MIKLNKWQQSVVDLITEVPEDAEYIITGIGYSSYIADFRTFSFNVPRRIGKTILIQEIAKRVENPLIIVRNYSMKSMYPKSLYKFIKIANAIEYLPTNTDCLLQDEINLRINSNIIANSKADWFNLSVGTKIP